MIRPNLRWVKRATFFPSKDLPLLGKWNLYRELAKDKGLSSNALLRLEWMIFYQTAGHLNATATAAHFGVSRKTFHKWLSRFNDENLLTLEEESRAPKRKRSWLVSYEQEDRVKALREKHLKYGKLKLQVLYRTQYQEEISTWKIARVIRKHQLYPDKALHLKRLKRKAKADRAPKKRISEVAKPSTFGYLWHIDSIILSWYGARRVIFTAIEDLTKLGFARTYTTNSSGFAGDFLERLMYLVKGKVELMHSDNGSEFEGDFALACETLKIERIYSRPRTPKDNPALERFNWTVQDEWLSLSEKGLDEIVTANQDLSKWLVEYNAYRPHASLDYQTPLEYAQARFFSKVLPMWSASTNP